jgi:site-specific recombinase XerD
MNYVDHLSNKGYAKNTIDSYSFTVDYFLSSYKELTHVNLKSYKLWLIENCKPRTANLRIAAINNYLEYSGKSEMKLQSVKVQQQTFLENVISFPDYEYLKGCLLKDHKMIWYYVVRFLGSTGARISELLQIKVEHIKAGYVDLYTKGGKIRRIYIPSNLQTDAIRWLSGSKTDSGHIFINQNGRRLTPKGVSTQLKAIANQYGVDQSVVHPHSFRHMFAKTFIERYNDIALLADLMGHESIETTRIYLRKTTNEQQSIVNRTVDW